MRLRNIACPLFPFFRGLSFGTKFTKGTRKLHYSPRLSAEYKPFSLVGQTDRYNGITVNLAQLDSQSIQLSEFRQTLQDCLQQWEEAGHTAVWLRVPIHRSDLITIAAEYGFVLHHAENDFSLLKLWLQENSQDMLPRFATHQVGVAGAVVRDDTKEVLVIQDKNVNRPMWKLPGGVSDLGEDIAATAVREVFEETGIQAEFRSVLAFRQQHLQPGAFGRSDIYVVCRMTPVNLDIHPCQTEILRCEWMPLHVLHDSTTTPITKRLVKLISFGLNHGFDSVDITQEKMKSIHKGLTYFLFHRPFSDN